MDFVCPDTGTMEILIDKVHIGLLCGTTTLMLIPFDTDDILSGLLCASSRRATSPLIGLATG